MAGRCALVDGRHRRQRHNEKDATTRHLARSMSTADADLVMTGGNVWTMDSRRPRAEAVAVAGGRIVAVGSSRDVGALRFPRTRRIDLNGRTLLPGFQDAHVHPSM